MFVHMNYIATSIHMHKTCTHIHMHTYMHTYIHICMHVYTHIHTMKRMSRLYHICNIKLLIQRIAMSGKNNRLTEDNLKLRRLEI